MNSVVIYGSHFGNTRRVAEAISDGLKPFGTVQLLSADNAPSWLPEKTDLLVIGGPTEAFRMTPPVARLLDRLEAATVAGVAAAVFDTRMRPQWWMFSYAAPGIAKRMRSLGAELIAPPEGFLVEGAVDEKKGQYPTLVAGELKRATEWAASLAAKVGGRLPASIAVASF
jgi:flavodoxin